MIALSIRQPWASMIARGEKTIETEPVAFHGVVADRIAKRQHTLASTGVENAQGEGEGLTGPQRVPRVKQFFCGDVADLFQSQRFL